jgi:hypothetical protein
MDGFRKAALPIAFVVNFLVIGIPYWLIPYRMVELPDSLVAPGLFLLGFSALALSAGGVSSLWKIAGIMGASMPAAVLARVAVDCARDPTSHNLWPFEIVIALSVGLAAAATGTLIGLFAAWLMRRARGVDI